MSRQSLALGKEFHVATEYFRSRLSLVKTKDCSYCNVIFLCRDRVLAKARRFLVATVYLGRDRSILCCDRIP